MDNQKVLLYFNESSMIKYELYYPAEDWVDYDDVNKDDKVPYSYKDLMEGKTNIDPNIIQERYVLTNTDLTTRTIKSDSDLMPIPDYWWKEAHYGALTVKELLAHNSNSIKKALLGKMGWEKFFETIPLENIIDTYVDPALGSIDLCLYKNSSLDITVAFLRNSSGKLIQVDINSKSAEDTLKTVIKAKEKKK